VDIADVHERFSVDTRIQPELDNTDQPNVESNIDSNKEDDNHSQLRQYNIHDVEMSVNRSPSRVKQIDQKERLKLLVKRMDTTPSPRLQFNDRRTVSGSSPNQLMRKINSVLRGEQQRVKSEISPQKTIKPVKESRDNPLLADEMQKGMVGLSRSRSEKGLVADSKIGHIVKTLKHDLEKEKALKCRAIEILKSVKKSQKIVEVMNFLEQNKI